ncbi:hypothetical protein [Sphingomonas sp.]|uniref:hypothetical protein n=1 Tax=Sphingomonadales TaxID=204457 RepID=UPI0035C84031
MGESIAEVAAIPGVLTKSQHSAWIWTVLAVAATGPQRNAFLQGYNRQAIPPHASARMREYYARGIAVSVHLISQGADYDR